MIAAMRDIHSSKLVGLHRTFLNRDGTKAVIEGSPTRQFLGSVKNAAIMIDGFDEVATGLHIAEGVEDALTARCGGWAPVWALGSAGGISRFPVLPGIEALTILVDADEAGRMASETCGARWADAGVEVRLVEPIGHKDWNETLTAKPSEAA